MKVCLVSIAPFLGGAEVALERLALGLKKKVDHVVCVLGTKNEVGKHFTSRGIHWNYLPLPFTNKWTLPYYFYALFRTRFFLKRSEVDLIHANDLPSFQFVSHAARPLGIPRVCHHRYIFNGEAIKWFLKFGVEYQLFVSNALRNDLEIAYPPLKSQPGEVVYDGLPLPPLKSLGERKELKRRLNLPLNKTVVLFAGQIIPRKGVQDLIKAWTFLSPRARDDAHLVIIGDDLAGKGAYKYKMENFAQELGVPADFRGFQGNVDDWLEAADIVTVPSHIEPLGNATLEAMAHARPVIGSSVGGIPEMIVDGETGLLIPPQSPKALAEAIVSLTEDPALISHLGNAARQRCKELFSLERHVEGVVNIYKKIV